MKKVIGIIIVLLIITTFSGCYTTTEIKQADYRNNTLGKEAAITEQNQERLLNNQPVEQVDYSNERDNLNKRNKEWNDKNKIGYLYCIGDTGAIIAFYTIKGKVSSINSMLTTNLQMVRNPFYYINNSSADVLLMESPNLDGSYGTNGDGIFFYLTDGTYAEWNGKYMLTSQPIKLSTPPIMTYEMRDITRKDQ